MLLIQRQFVEFFAHTETVCRFFSHTETICRVISHTECKLGLHKHVGHICPRLGLMPYLLFYSRWPSTRSCARCGCATACRSSARP